MSSTEKKQLNQTSIFRVQHVEFQECIHAIGAGHHQEVGGFQINVHLPPLPGGKVDTNEDLIFQ